MPELIEPTVITRDAPPRTEPLSWDQLRRSFDAEKSYWLATAGPGGRPQIRPVLAVCIADRIYSTTSPGARKGHNLERHGECSLAASAPAIDIVIEGSASWVDERGVLEQIAAAYDRKYGWPVTITSENMFTAPYGAPTAGPPPYRVYQLTPAVAYGFGTGDDLGVRSTRFRFSR
jgi:hypothetical protein